MNPAAILSKLRMRFALQEKCYPAQRPPVHSNFFCELATVAATVSDVKLLFVDEIIPTHRRCNIQDVFTRQRPVQENSNSGESCGPKIESSWLWTLGFGVLYKWAVTFKGYDSGQYFSNLETLSEHKPQRLSLALETRE